MLVVDTREQRPIWDPREADVLRVRLEEGDYTTTELIGKAHIERKSGNDLYGSIIQDHDRFRAELVRAKEKGLKLAIFVECPKEDFFAKRFKGGSRRECEPARLRKIIGTIERKYDVEFHWCSGRREFKERAIQWLAYQKSIRT